MKKNKMMRIASILMVVTLLSTCAISGTFAKYVTKASGEDAARVAKWGIVLTMEGDAVFKTEYEADDENFTLDDYSVVSADDDKVVAPGTEGEKITATIQGDPEVAFRLILDLNVENEICLKKGDYTDYTQLVPTDATNEAGATVYGYDETFNVAEDYYPVQFTLKSGTHSVTGSVKDITTALQNVVASMGGAAGVDADGSVTGIEGAIYADFPANCGTFEEAVPLELSWAWAFEQEMDEADTYLGNVIAGVVEDENAITDMDVTFTAIAVQID